ncbi:MAG: hypothetical protein AAF269_04480 [Pseudomonadota bacterium]
MTDFEIANQITDTMNLFLQGFAMLSTVVFAYIAGAFYFLNRAPFFTKVMSFIFLVFAVSFILINMMGAFYHYMALADQVDLRVAAGNASFLIEAVHEGRTREMAFLGLWTIAPVGLGTVAMCFWMTFFWHPRESLDASGPDVPV